MKRRSVLHLAWGLAGQGVLGRANANADPAPASDLQWVERTFNAMGTSMTIRVAHHRPELAALALDAARREVHQIEDQMSVFRDDSVICQLNRAGHVSRPPAQLLQVLRIAQDISRRSAGSFDVTVQPLWQVFAAAQAEGRLPTPQQVQAARAHVGWQQLQVSQREIRFASPGMGMTLNGIVPGFAADTVKATLQRMGVRHASIDTGEWAVLGHAPQGGDWTLGIANPRDAQALLARVALGGQCLATSADNECHFSDDFVHHHIFDPHTGYSPTELSCVSVLAPTCVVADAVTKVLFTASFDAALRLAQTWKVQALVVKKNGQWRATAGFPLRAV
jgi:thiamine biosynthesis lipoprotein